MLLSDPSDSNIYEYSIFMTFPADLQDVQISKMDPPKMSLIVGDDSDDHIDHVYTYIHIY